MEHDLWPSSWSKFSFSFFLTCLIDIVLLEDLIEIVKLKILIIIIYNTWDANHLMSL